MRNNFHTRLLLINLKRDSEGHNPQDEVTAVCTCLQNDKRSSRLPKIIMLVILDGQRGLWARRCM